MTSDRSRRELLTGDLLSALRKFLGGGPGIPAESSAMAPDYFESFETCYPLLSEAGDLLMEEASRLGIDTRGKSRLEIAREVFQTTKKAEAAGLSACITHNKAGKEV